MERKKLIDLLPEFVRQFKEFQEIMKAEEVQINVIAESVQRALNNAFIEDCDEYGIKKYETLLNIIPNADDSLETRKARVLLRWNDGLPYTYKTLIKKLDAFLGKEEYNIALDAEGYQLNIEVSVASESMIDDIKIMLNHVIPVNMVIHLTLLYETHEYITGYTHLQLNSFTHEQIKNKKLRNQI